MNNLNRETASAIVDLFEDFLDVKGIKIHNEERDKQDPDNEANLWGPDFDELMNGITRILGASGIHVAETFNSAVPAEPKDETLTIYVPLFDEIVKISEECVTSGIELCTTLNVWVYDAESFCISPSFLRKCKEAKTFRQNTPIREKYNSIAEAVPDILNYIYNDNEDRYDISWIELSGGKAWRKAE